MSETTTCDDLPRQTSTVERAVAVALMVGLAVLVPLMALAVGASRHQVSRVDTVVGCSTT